MCRAFYKRRPPALIRELIEPVTLTTCAIYIRVKKTQAPKLPPGAEAVHLPGHNKRPMSIGTRMTSSEINIPAAAELDNAYRHFDVRFTGALAEVESELALAVAKGASDWCATFRAFMMTTSPCVHRSRC